MHTHVHISVNAPLPTAKILLARTLSETLAPLKAPQRAALRKQLPLSSVLMSAEMSSSRVSQIREGLCYLPARAAPTT